MSTLSDLLSSHDRKCELSLILHMVYENHFIEIVPEAFYVTQARESYEAIADQHNEHGSIELTALPDTVRECVFEIADYHYPKDITIIKKKVIDNYNTRKAAITISKAFKTLNSSTIYESLSQITRNFSAIATGDDITYDHGKSVYKFLEYCKEQKDSDHRLSGISSELPYLDNLLGGWQKGKTYILGGMEKLGKSRFCAYLTSVWAKKNIGGMWFSMEMQENDIHECILSNRSIVDSSLIGSPSIQTDQFDKVLRSSQNYLNEPLSIITESSISPEFIREKIRAQKVMWKKQGHSVVYVVVDYIQRMVSGENQPRQLEDAAKKLADIGRDEGVIMIVISQLSQAAEREHNMSPHQFIKGSKGIREAADAILVLYKIKKDIEADDAKDIGVYVVQRKGKSNLGVAMRAQLQYTSFKELGKDEAKK